jgi:hypothetical protein
MCISVPRRSRFVHLLINCIKVTHKASVLPSSAYNRLGQAYVFKHCRSFAPVVRSWRGT